MKKCESCNEKWDIGYKFCRYCGYSPPHPSISILKEELANVGITHPSQIRKVYLTKEENEIQLSYFELKHHEDYFLDDTGPETDIHEDEIFNFITHRISEGHSLIIWPENAAFSNFYEFEPFLSHTKIVNKSKDPDKIVNFRGRALLQSEVNFLEEMESVDPAQFVIVGMNDRLKFMYASLKAFVENTRVIGLTMKFYKSIYIPKVIEHFTSLLWLDYEYIALSQVPEFIGNLKALKILKISPSLFSEKMIKQIPKFIGNLKNLLELDLSKNQIEEIPEIIGDLKNLEILNLSENPIKMLPKSLSNLSSLKNLIINQTLLSEEAKAQLTILKESGVEITDRYYKTKILDEIITQVKKREKEYPKERIVAEEEVGILNLSNLSDEARLDNVETAKKLLLDEDLDDIPPETKNSILNTNIRKKKKKKKDSQFVRVYGKKIEVKKDGFLGLSSMNIKKISDVKGLESLANLQTLDLQDNQITKIKGLKSLANLQKLLLDRNKITEIKGLETLTNLQYLSLFRNQITEIKGLETLTNLQDLSLFSNQITEIKGLESLANLQTLYLGGNPITKIKGLESLANLQTLYLGGNPITKIKGLETLTNLEELSLTGNQITKIKGLETLTNLEALYLEVNQITEIEGLESLANLQILRLDCNQITEIKGLESLANLQRLLLDSNQITKIKGLESLANLQYLHLENNQITKIKGLESLTNLQYLCFKNNQITEIEGLESLANLKWLRLNKNQITEIKGLESLFNLQRLDIYSNLITEIKGLESLANLQELNLNYNKITEISLFVSSGVFSANATE